MRIKVKPKVSTAKKTRAQFTIYSPNLLWFAFRSLSVQTGAIVGASLMATRATVREEAWKGRRNRGANTGCTHGRNCASSSSQSELAAAANLSIQTYASDWSRNTTQLLTSPNRLKGKVVHQLLLPSALAASACSIKLINFLCPSLPAQPYFNPAKGWMRWLTLLCIFFAAV